MDRRASRHRWEESAPPIERPYAGLVTRAIAFGLDAALINAVAALVGLTVGLALSVLHLPAHVDEAIAAVMAVLWIGWSISYFAFFWASTGQTPGDRVMQIQVVDMHRRGPIKPVRALIRVGGLLLAALPLLAGYLMMLYDKRARCLQDHLARTVVIHALDAGPALRSRRARWAEPDDDQLA
jgi:uncharacterized RDD family membrane protein YckC